MNGVPKEASRKIDKQLKPPLSEISRMENVARTEHAFLKVTKNENLGVYSDLFSAKSGIDGQDGGMVTALLLSGLRKGVFDAAIVVQRKPKNQKRF